LLRSGPRVDQHPEQRSCMYIGVGGLLLIIILVIILL
jgi:hypothetical protein